MNQQRTSDPTPQELEQRQELADQIGTSLDMLKASIAIYLHRYPDADRTRMKAAILTDLNIVLP